MHPGDTLSDCFDAETFVGKDDTMFFRQVHGRRLNAMNPRYLLPADKDELDRYKLHHRMMQFVFEGRNYPGPVREILTSPLFKHKKRVLDLGTGGGEWAMDIADEFSRVEVTGVDIAPIQPRDVPPNCAFELCDLEGHDLPYVSNSYDVIHVRSIHTGIRDYRQFIIEVTRMLRPGGLLILIEPDTEPIVDGHLKSCPPAPLPTSLGGSKRKRTLTHIPSNYASGAPGWFALWEAYRKGLEAQNIDVTVPQRLGSFVNQTDAYETISVQEAMIPIGFWPTDPTLLTIGQLAWMEFDLLLPAMRPHLLSSGIPEWKADILIGDAQRDLYEPVMPPSCRLHVVHAIKREEYY
ncbi:hypothetical protein JAAARDRAFT_202378 [Jaapia argillacea MUCL 33604]|uniref:Methyltransferase domain-containing protein n=1 Tax=Jaapia argillacea MUCL 33604 TaxID=933084 RepID=A0A067QR25_9AGAM|nr:hypothetical protein JAAARDRAFT_202378 [Jaapia argillacea MUCL 33604]